MIDLATVARPDMLDVIAFHGKPIVVGFMIFLANKGPLA